MLQTSRKLFFSARKKQTAPISVFLRRLKILPLRTALSVIERRSKPTIAVNKNIILMIRTKLFFFSHEVHVCLLRREVPNDCMTSQSEFYKNQLGAVYARASRMFHLLILEFYFAVIYYSSNYVFSSLSFDTTALGSGF